MMITTTQGILNCIEECFDANTRDFVIKHAIEGVPNYPVQLLIDSINAELTRLHMPYVIEDIMRPSKDLWKIKMNLYPSKLNWNEIVKLDERGEAVYQTLLEPFKDANIFFPTSLRSAMELFKIDSDGDWRLGNYRDWLLGINTAFYPHECKAIMQKLMAITVRI
jgi:hypothetical protein